LLDKITGKLPKELRQGKAKTLAPIGGSDDTKSQHSASHSSLRKTDKPSEIVKPDVVTGHESSDQKTEPKVWSELDKYIELLLDSKSEEETVFMYLNPNAVSSDPYDLQVTSYEKRNPNKYYTLSGKGLTLSENENPVECISLGQWLIERDSYNHIKELSFFKQFKKWKFMRMWKKTIKQTNRSKAQNSLDEKLFVLQDHFGPHLFKHRRLMIEMQSQLKFVDVCQTGDVKTIAQFAEAQIAKRNKVEEEIKQCSNKSRQNIQTCMQSVLEALRGRIISEISLDEQRSKHNPIQSSNTVGMKRKEPNNAFEKLNFPSGMTYGHRSSLRKECSKFLRFAYLVDFISLEALANIYKNSVEELIARL
jgi:dynein heavy chain